MSTLLSMILGLRHGGWELNADEATGLGGAEGGACWALDSSMLCVRYWSCGGGGGGKGALISNVERVEGAVRGRSMLRRSANDGPEGGISGIGGMGSSSSVAL